MELGKSVTNFLKDFIYLLVRVEGQREKQCGGLIPGLWDYEMTWVESSHLSDWATKRPESLLPIEKNRFLSHPTQHKT